MPLTPSIHNADEEKTTDDIAHVAEGVPVVHDDAPWMQTLKIKVADVLQANTLIFSEILIVNSQFFLLF
jgi:hypothetical protein